MGEQHFGNLLPFLFSTLISEAGSVERSGAAQGLSEVLAALGNKIFYSNSYNLLIIFFNNRHIEA